MKIPWIFESAVPAARALATGPALLDTVVGADSDPAVLYGAALEGEAIALGAWQRRCDAVQEEAVADAGVQVLRRRTGGPMVVASQDVVYVALCLRHASVLMDCPSDRLLNRNVRGALGGLTRPGAPAHYPGRDWLTVGRRPAVQVGWDRDETGRVLIEMFVAHRRSFVPDGAWIAYPARSEDQFAGKEQVTLEEAWDEVVDPLQVVRSIAEGHSTRFEGPITTEHVTVPRTLAGGIEAAEAWVRASADPTESTLTWSKLREVPIGFISAGVRLDGSGTTEDVRVAGDFFQDRAAPIALSERLLGKVPDKGTLAAAAEATWARGGHQIEGLTDLSAIVGCLDEAVSVCRSAPK